MRKTMKAIVLALCLLLCISVFVACNETPEHEHNYTQIKSNSIEHWYVCPDDGEEKPDSRENHIDSNRIGKCDVCGHDVDILELNGVSFAISGNDGGTVVQLNGQSVTITNKNNNKPFTATIADGKFITTEIVPIGDYTVSLDGYKSATLKITKDGASAVVLYVDKQVENSVEIKEVDGVPTLIVEGMIPTVQNVTPANVMLHFHGDDVDDKYFNNISKYDGVYRFEMSLAEIPVVNSTPWFWFHIYPYAEENPTKDSTPLTTEGSLCNLNRGSKINVGDSYTYNEAKYTVQGNDQLVIQAKALPKATVTSIEFDTTQNKVEIVVKGTKLASVGDIKLHADSEGGSYYGNNVSNDATTFECRFDFTTVVTEKLPQKGSGAGWAWFHIYTYNDANPSNDKIAKPDGSFDLERNGLIANGAYVELNDVHYEIENQGQLAISYKAIPKTQVTSIEFDTTGTNPVLVVKGTKAAGVGDIKIHAICDNTHYYGNNVSNDSATFECRFDFTQVIQGKLTDSSEPTSYFHIYTYNDANPTEDKLAKPDAEFNLDGKSLIANGRHFVNNVRYDVNNESWGQITVKFKNEQAFEVTSISIDTSNGAPTLVVNFVSNSAIPCIKLHAGQNNVNYFGEAVTLTTAGNGTIKFDLSQIPAGDNPWYWFHICVYTDVAPSNDTAWAKKEDLKNDAVFGLTDGANYTYNNVKYTVLVKTGDGENTWGNLVISPTAVEN